MAMTAGGRGGIKSDINVTPLVDVVLVLLIIFMVVTPALLAGFNADPPKGQNLKEHPEDAENDQVLGIDKDALPALWDADFLYGPPDSAGNASARMMSRVFLPSLAISDDFSSTATICSFSAKSSIVFSDCSSRSLSCLI